MCSSAYWSGGSGCTGLLNFITRSWCPLLLSVPKDAQVSQECDIPQLRPHDEHCVAMKEGAYRTLSPSVHDVLTEAVEDTGAYPTN